MEDGKPRFIGLSLEEAQVQVRSWINHAEMWLDAAEEMQKALQAERLTPQEEETVQRMVKRNRKKLKAKGISPEEARAVYSRDVLARRGDDFSDL
jgi:type VI protein secretion system component VasF